MRVSLCMTVWLTVPIRSIFWQVWKHKHEATAVEHVIFPLACHAVRSYIYIIIFFPYIYIYTHIFEWRIFAPATIEGGIWVMYDSLVSFFMTDSGHWTWGKVWFSLVFLPVVSIGRSFPIAQWNGIWIKQYGSIWCHRMKRSIEIRTVYNQRKFSLKTSELRTMVMVSIHTVMSTTSSCQPPI